MSNEKRPNNPSMKDVAKRAGVSQPTVSRALRNDPRVAPATLEKINQAVDELGYRPNPYISTLMTQLRPHRRANNPAVLAILDCWNDDDPHPPNLLAYKKAVQNRGHTLGFDVQLFRLKDVAGSVKRMGQIFLARGIRAIIILPVPSGCDLSDLPFEHLASATIGTSLHRPHCQRAAPDIFHGTLLALNTLKKKGYKRIGLCSIRSVMDRLGLERMGAYQAWSAQQPISQRVPPCIESGTGAELDAWLAASKPDAVFTNLSYVVDCMETRDSTPPVYLYEQGFIPLNREGLTEHADQISAVAMNLVAAQISRNEYGLPAQQHTTLVESSWVIPSEK